VLELAAHPVGSEPLPLAMAEPRPFVGRRVFAIGHPIADFGTPLAIIERIFGDPALLGTKRFSPGTVMQWSDDKTFQHDASTLPGSSGSCIVDFESNEVIGIHFAGQYHDANYAVPLWRYSTDPVLAEAGVVF
jgi:endonuclease G